VERAFYSIGQSGECIVERSGLGDGHGAAQRNLGVQTIEWSAVVASAADERASREPVLAFVE
jgi:hypothetical protein